MARKWVVGAVAVVVTLLLAFGVAGPIELPVRDGVLRLLRAKPAAATVIVVIDEASIRTIGPWPWSRTHLPALVDPIVAFRPRPRDVPQIAAATLLNGGDAAMLKGKLVFIGPTAFGLGDRVITPVTGRRSADPGVTVHAAATESMLRHETIHEMPPIASGVVAAAAVAFVLFARRLRITALVLLVATFGGGIPLLAFTGVAIPFVTLTACIAFTFGVLEARTLLDALRRSEGVPAGPRPGREAE